MSPFTSAICYRAGDKPPIVTTQDLAVFTERILALDILQPDFMIVHLKFGQAIDQDKEGIAEISETIASLLYYDWDVDEGFFPREEALAFLRNPPEFRIVKRERRHLLDFGPKNVVENFGPHIYRAHLMFRTMKEEVYTPICHKLYGDSLILSELDYHIGPVQLFDTVKNEIYYTGWMNFAVNGDGYLYPYTYREILENLRTHPVLQQIRDICREMWPSTTVPPNPEVVHDRSTMGKMWAEPEDAPYDWYWAINGS
ncbi:MAG: hypothetical protein ACYDCO_04140 [Armatimonadota bacterium]